MTLTFFGWLSHAIQLSAEIHVSVRTPRVLLPRVWPLPRSLATTNGISVDFSSSWYLDVSVPLVPFIQLCIHCMIPLQVGFPIRKSPDRSSFAAPRSLSQLITSFIGS